MAFSDRLQFILDLDPSNAITGLKKVGDTAEREIGRTDDRLNRIGGRMQTAGVGMMAFAGVAAGALGSFAQAAEEAEAQSRKLDQAMGSNTSFAEAGREPFEKLAESIQNLTGVDGDAILGMEGFLGTLGRTSGEALALTPLIVDLSKRFGLELEPAARLVNNAIEGSTGRLERMIGPMREGETVTAALARTVGGFAERDAQSFSGQLDIMKAKLGDLAEGIGVGVIDAFSGFVDIAGSVTDKFTSMSAGTQAGIGKFAAYATAATGAIGALSFLAGTVAKLSDRFTSLDVDTGTRSLTNFGKVAAGVGLVGLVAGIAAMGTEMSKLRIDIDEFNTALEETEDGTLELSVAIGRAEGFEHLANTIGDQSVPSLERFRDALVRNKDELGLNEDQIAEVTAVLDEKRAADVQGAIDQENYSTSVGEAVEASGELEEVTRDVNQQLEDNHARNLEVIESRDALVESTLALFDKEIAYRDSIRGTNDAITEYTTVAGDGEASADDIAAAQDEAAQAALRQAQAALEAQAAIALQDGKQLTAAESARVQRGTLEAIAATLAPDSPLRVQLQGYIDQLAGIERNIVTNIETVYNAPTGSVPRGQTPVQRRARGGPVEKGTPYLVGDKHGITDSTELFIPGESGVVRPITTTTGTPMAAGRGMGGTPTEQLVDLTERQGRQLAEIAALLEAGVETPRLLASHSRTLNDIASAIRSDQTPKVLAQMLAQDAKTATVLERMLMALTTLEKALNTLQNLGAQQAQQFAKVLQQMMRAA